MGQEGNSRRAKAARVVLGLVTIAGLGWELLSPNASWFAKVLAISAITIVVVVAILALEQIFIALERRRVHAESDDLPPRPPSPRTKVLASFGAFVIAAAVAIAVHIWDEHHENTPVTKPPPTNRDITVERKPVPAFRGHLMLTAAGFQPSEKLLGSLVVVANDHQCKFTDVPQSGKVQDHRYRIRLVSVGAGAAQLHAVQLAASNVVCHPTAPPRLPHHRKIRIGPGDAPFAFHHMVQVSVRGLQPGSTGVGGDMIDVLTFAVGDQSCSFHRLYETDNRRFRQYHIKVTGVDFNAGEVHLYVRRGSPANMVPCPTAQP